MLHSLRGKLGAEKRVVDELMLINQVFPGASCALSLDVRKRIVQARFHGLEGVFVAPDPRRSRASSAMLTITPRLWGRRL